MAKVAAGPGVIPVTIPGAPDTDMLAMAIMDQPLSTVRETYETGTFSDALPHDLAFVEVLAGRTSPTSFIVTAHDDALNRIAFASADISFSRSGAGVLSLFAAIVSGGFNPNVAPWNTITATAVVVGTNGCVIRVVGLAGITIRWGAWIGIEGAQAR